MAAQKCQAKFRSDPNKRCGRYATKGHIYCKYHGGHQDSVRVDKLPTFYSERLSGTLRDYVNTAMGCAPSEQVNVLEELALIRAEAARVVALYNAAVQLGNDRKTWVAAELMTSALKEVVRVADVATKINNAANEKISVFNLAHTVNQIVRIAYDVFGSKDVAKAERFERLVREKVRVLEEAKGTDSTPDQDVAEMDATIPREPGA
jgi:hypothetical protein